MSIAIMSQVWTYSGHKGGDLLVLLAMADHANDDGVCWPGVEGLARKSRMSERNVQLCLRKLEIAGEIVAIERGGIRGGKRLATTYRIKMGEISSPMPKGEISSSRRVKPTSPQSSVEPSVYILEELGLEADNYSGDLEWREALLKFIQSRKERRQPMTKTACILLTKRIIAMGVKESTAALLVSAENGWNSIFPRKEDRKLSSTIISPRPLMPTAKQRMAAQDKQYGS